MKQRLSKVFGIHRYIAAFFGVGILFSSDSYYESPRNKLYSKSWAACILGLAILLNSFVGFEPQEQSLFAKAVIVGFTGEVILFWMASNDPEAIAGIKDESKQLQFTFGIFLSIVLFYLYALLEKIPKSTPSLKWSPTLLQPAFWFHAIFGLPIAFLFIFYPQKWFSLAEDADNYTQAELFMIQCWGCFILLLSGNASVAAYYKSQAQHSIAASMAVMFFILTILYFFTYMRDGLPRLELWATPVFPIFGGVYMWALLRSGNKVLKRD